MIAPEMPTGGLVGQAILDDEAHRQGNDAMGIAGSRQSVLGRVGVEELLAAGATVLRILQMNVAGTADNEVANVMQDARVHGLPKTRLATMWTRAVCEVAAPPNDLRWRQLSGISDALGGVRQILSRARHGNALVGQVSSARNLRHLLVSVMTSCQ